MLRRFEVAIAGTGTIAGIHAAALSMVDGRARLVAATDTDPGRLRAFAKEWSVPACYPDLAALLEHAAPDLVLLCTPPATHAAQAIACLRRGISVLCEKPTGCSLAELDRIARAEQAAGAARVGTVFQHRFGSGAGTLRRLVSHRPSPLGAPLAAVCHTLWHRPDEYFAVPWRGTWAAEGGGPTLGHGIHQMDLMLSILGPWREVTAVAARLARRTETEDISCAIVTFASGALATVVNSLLSPRQTSYLRFDFSNATVELEHLYGYDDSQWTVTPAPGHERVVARAWAAGPKGRPSGHAAQFEEVFDALAAGRPLPVGLPDARATLELVTAVYASAFTGQPVRRGAIGPGSPFYHRLDGTGAPWR